MKMVSTVEGEFGEYLLLQVYYLSMVGMKEVASCYVKLRCRSTLRISFHVVPYLTLLSPTLITTTNHHAPPSLLALIATLT